MTLPTITKEQAIVWLRMLSRACALIVASAAALGMSEWMIAATAIVGQLAVERLAMFSNDVIDKAYQEPNRLQEQQIIALEYQLRVRDAENERLRSDRTIKLTPMPEPKPEPKPEPEPESQSKAESEQRLDE